MALKITQVKGTVGARHYQKESLRCLRTEAHPSKRCPPRQFSGARLDQVVRHLVDVEEVAGE